MQTILIAGGAGFIGSHLCEQLLAKGKNIICVDSLITGSKKNIEHLIPNPHFTFLQQDVVNTTINLPENSNLDYIFHLASPASPNKKSPKSYINFPIETMLVNSAGTYSLLELAQQHNAKFLYTSTSEVYGDPAITPQHESYYGNVNPVGVRSVYDEGKRFGEAITMAYIRKYSLDARIIRIFNTYGSQMQVDDGRVVSNFITQALLNKPITIYGDGSQTRSFCYISDMVTGLISAAFLENTKGEVINIGNPDERTVLELATMIKGKLNSTSPIQTEELPEDDPKVRQPDITKAKQLLHWEPKIGIDEGLSKTIEYFRKVLV